MGCPRAIASSSYASELVKEEKVKNVLKMDDLSIRKEPGLEDPKFLCVSLPLKVIQKAIEKI
jgi:NifU-like protein involved in Fe-S cluster formation